MMPFYLLMLAGVAAGYYAGIAAAKRLGRGENSFLPVLTAVAGGMVAYGVALMVAPPMPTGDIVWAGPVHQVFEQDELDGVLADAPSQITLVDFYANWCAPCHRGAEHLNEIAMAGANVIVIDVERAPWMAERYNVIGLPTTIAFFGDREIQRVEGYSSKRELEKLLTRSTGS
jgi:thioredoxin 1